MLPRVVLASLCLANVAHAQPASEQVGAAPEPAAIIITSSSSEHMTTYVPPICASHRSLDAYIRDTVRYIRTLDIKDGVVIQRWAGFVGDNTGVAFGLTDPMDPEIPDVAQLLASTPSTPAISVTVESYLPAGKP